MTKEDQYLEIILQTSEWFDRKKEQLQLVVDKENESKIFFEGEDGEKVALPDELKKGFVLGVKMAIETIGEFPIKIAKSNETE